MKTCTTHHDACPCRETLAVIQMTLLRSQISRLKTTVETIAGFNPKSEVPDSVLAYSIGLCRGTLDALKGEFPDDRQ